MHEVDGEAQCPEAPRHSPTQHATDRRNVEDKPEHGERGERVGYRPGT